MFSARRCDLLVLLFLGLCACSPSPQEMLEKAHHLRSEGKMNEAVAILSRLAEKHPRSSESAKIGKTEADWLTEDASTSEPSKRKELLTQALSKSPTHGEAQVGLCQLLLDTKDYAGLEKCVAEGLTGKEGVPQDRVQALKEALHQHRLEEDAICPHLDALVALLLADGRWFSQLVPRMRAASSPLESLSLMEALRKEASSRVASDETFLAYLGRRLVSPAEEPVREHLVRFYKGSMGALEAMASDDEDVPARLTRIVESSRDIPIILNAASDALSAECTRIHTKPADGASSASPPAQPSEADWARVPEVTVTGSSALRCETKVLDGNLQRRPLAAIA